MLFTRYMKWYKVCGVYIITQFLFILQPFFEKIFSLYQLFPVLQYRHSVKLENRSGFCAASVDFCVKVSIVLLTILQIGDVPQRFTEIIKSKRCQKKPWLCGKSGL